MSDPFLCLECGLPHSGITCEMLNEARIVAAHNYGKCACGGEIEHISNHERDSSNDVHRCERCGWSYSEMATWGLKGIDEA